MKVIPVSERLWIELWTSKYSQPPVIHVIHSGGGNVYVRLEDVRPLVSALTYAAADLAELELEQKGGNTEI